MKTQGKKTGVDRQTTDRVARDAWDAARDMEAAILQLRERHLAMRERLRLLAETVDGATRTPATATGSGEGGPEA